jgi:hypothetical protein
MLRRRNDQHEIFSQASGFGMTVKEVPVSHFPRQHGKPTGGSVAVIVKAFRELVRLRRILSTARPDENGAIQRTGFWPNSRTLRLRGESRHIEPCVRIEASAAGRRS